MAGPMMKTRHTEEKYAIMHASRDSIQPQRVAVAVPKLATNKKPALQLLPALIEVYKQNSPFNQATLLPHYPPANLP